MIYIQSVFRVSTRIL